jgi:transposase
MRLRLQDDVTTIGQPWRQVRAYVWTYDMSSYTSLTTRRTWSFAEKSAILAEMAVPGAIVMAVARRHGIAQSLLYRWRQDAATAALATAAVAEAPPSFVPVVIDAAPAASPVPPRPSRKRAEPAGVAPLASIIEIDLPGGRTVRAMADIDAAALARIVAALEGNT